MEIIKQIVNIICFFAIFWINICKAEVRVAIIVPKTGESKIWGDELIFGAKTAIDEINISGGILNKKVELVAIDDTCNDNLAISTAQMLSVSSSIKPSLVVGPYCSNSFDDVAKIFSKSKILQIVPIALKYHDMSLKHKGVIKLVSFKEQVGKDFFALYNEKYAGLKTAFVYDDVTDGSKEVIGAVSAEFRKYGKNSLLKEYNYGKYEDLDSLVSEIVSSNVDIIYLMGNPKKNGKLIKKIATLDSAKIFFTSKYLATEDFFENSKGFLDNVYFMALPTFEKNPNFTENMVSLRLKGIEFEGLNIYGYAAIKTWASLVEKTGGFSYDKLSSEIKNNDVNNMWSKSFFNNANIKNPIHYVFYQYNNGEFLFVE